MAQQPGRVRVPRSFVLLEEVDTGEKGSQAEGISWGPENTEDTELVNWIGQIVGPPNTAFHDRIYQLKIHCGASYPCQPPTVRFINKLNMKEVGANGMVSTKDTMLVKWQESFRIHNILSELRKLMTTTENRKKPQPPENSVYP